MLVPSVIPCCPPALQVGCALVGLLKGRLGVLSERCAQEARVQISRGSLREAVCSHHHLSQPLDVSSEDEQIAKCAKERRGLGLAHS